MTIKIFYEFKNLKHFSFDINSIFIICLNFFFFSIHNFCNTCPAFDTINMQNITMFSPSATKILLPASQSSIINLQTDLVRFASPRTQLFNYANLINGFECSPLCRKTGQHALDKNKICLFYLFSKHYQDTCSDLSHKINHLI